MIPLRRASSPVLAALLLALAPGAVQAQYFGRNKVQYEQFDFRVLRTPNYDVHFYPEAAGSAEDVARMAERWYERLARTFEHEVRERRPLILYAAHPHFQQTNVLRGMVGEGTGGVTEGLRDRIVMPLGESWGATDHVLGHELVHSFQFDIARSQPGSGLQGMLSLPLWFVEGMAEYLSVGPTSSLTAMWLRDAVLRDELPTLREMSRDPRYFPYRFGHAFWAWVAGTWGDAAVGEMFRVAARGGGWQGASAQVLGLSPDSLGTRWNRAVREHYAPLLEQRTPPGEAGTLLLAPATGAGTMNVAPSLSPDGRYVAFLSERDIFSVELFVADARTGEILRSLTSSTRDAHFDAIRFIDSSGAWSPDGRHVAVSVFADGRNRIQIYDASSGDVAGRLTVPRRIGEIRGPAYSPDGSRIVFSGQADGVTNLFLIDVESGEVAQLTDDPFTALQPTFSPDGRRVAFVTDRGPETGLERLTWGPMAIGLLDLDDGGFERLAPLGRADHWNPQFTPDGRGLYFLADPDGFRDVYRVALASGEVRRVTRIATGVSGITPSAPALSVARGSGSAAFSVFDGSEFHIYGLDAVGSVGDVVRPDEVVALEGRRLPGTSGDRAGRVARLLDDPDVGLHPPGTFRAEDARDFRPGLGLDYVGQSSIGAGQDRFGTVLSGAVEFSFSDLLGDRNLVVAAQAQGELKDLGGQVFYQDVGGRWNWGGGISHIPWRWIEGFRAPGPAPGLTEITFREQRWMQSQVLGRIQYPFSPIRRVEWGLGFTRWGFDVTDDVFIVDGAGRIVDRFRESQPAPDPLHLGEASMAFVQDNSYFGFTSPVRGWRSRYEVGQTVGSYGFTTLTFDHRSYHAPFRHLTLAWRALHVGRYGIRVDSGLGPLQPFFLGWEGLVRGYRSGSFQQSECTFDAEGACAEFRRLQGQRIGVASVEARIPILGTERYGILDFPYLPTELVLFTDGGVAWSAGDGADLRFDRETADRVPVFSSGVATRINLLGAFILEIYYAVPWQRPGRGAHFGFQFMPGW